MNEENKIVAGIKPRRTLRTLKTKSHTKRAVIRIVPMSASNAAFLSVMAGITVRKVDVAQWVDDIAFLYMDIRLRHQRKQNDRGSMVPSHLLTSYTGGIPGDCSKLLRFQNIQRRYATGRPILRATPPPACHEEAQPGHFFSSSADLALGVLAGQVISQPCALSPAPVCVGDLDPSAPDCEARPIRKAKRTLKTFTRVTAKRRENDTQLTLS